MQRALAGDRAAKEYLALVYGRVPRARGDAGRRAEHGPAVHGDRAVENPGLHLRPGRAPDIREMPPEDEVEPPPAVAPVGDDAPNHCSVNATIGGRADVLGRTARTGGR